MDDAWLQRGDDLEDADRREELKAEYAEKCRKACEGLPDGAIDGGWTAAGMSAYARKLEDALNQILCLSEAHIADAYIIAGEALAFRHNAGIQRASPASGEAPLE